MGRHGAPRGGRRPSRLLLTLIPLLVLVAGGGAYLWWTNRPEAAAAAQRPSGCPAPTAGAGGRGAAAGRRVRARGGRCRRHRRPTAIGRRRYDRPRPTPGRVPHRTGALDRLGPDHPPEHRCGPGSRRLGPRLVDVARRAAGSRRPPDLPRRLDGGPVGGDEPRRARLTDRGQPHGRHRPGVLVGPDQRLRAGAAGQPRQRHRRPAGLLRLPGLPARGARPRRRLEADRRLALRRGHDQVAVRRARQELRRPAVPGIRAGRVRHTPRPRRAPCGPSSRRPARSASTTPGWSTAPSRPTGRPSPTGRPGHFARMPRAAPSPRPASAPPTPRPGRRSRARPCRRTPSCRPRRRNSAPVRSSSGTSCARTCGCWPSSTCPGRCGTPPRAPRV